MVWSWRLLDLVARDVVSWVVMGTPSCIWNLSNSRRTSHGADDSGVVYLEEGRRQEAALLFQTVAELYRGIRRDTGCLDRRFCIVVKADA